MIILILIELIIYMKVVDSMKTLALILTGLFIALMIPFIHWHITDDQPLSVALIEPGAGSSDTEHSKGVTWLLRHQHHLSEEDQMQRYVSGESLTDRQLIVMNAASESENPDAQDQLVMDDVYNIKEAVMHHGTDVIAEFGSINGSPDVRQELEEFMQLEQTGWTGKHFFELNKDNADVPASVLEDYEDQHGPWDYEGGGVILIHEEDNQILVLSEERGDLDGSVHFQPTESLSEHYGVNQSVHYGGWFHVLEANHEDQVLATLTLDVTETGADMLSKNGLDNEIPGILHHQRSEAHIYYLNGQFTHLDSVSAPMQYTGTSKIRELLTFDAFFPENALYWKATAPLLQGIFQNSLRERDLQARNVPQNGEIHLPAKVKEDEEADQFEIQVDGEWVPLTIKGVNIGMGKPGYFPGEAAITYEEYYRWFEMIGDMNANAIRNYTLHPPEFYEALLEYNTYADEPLYLFHGVWIDEDPLEEELDAFAPGIPEAFQEEMETIADAIHGNAIVPPQPGHASGIYGADISDYVIAWIIGIEWYPYMVDEMLHQYPDMPDVDLTYLYTEDADPFEIWLAEQMDHLAAYEVENYGVMRPLSFTNWVTTDHIDQPAEPLEQEDLASVNPNTIKLQEEWQEAGMFASYHVYPYYPDFLNLEERYTEFIDHRGQPNNYAGYIHHLHEENDYPVLIAEFGVPASRGLTHRNPFGWNQGFIEEHEQGEIVTMLYEDMVHEGMLGGLIFAWQDEWFKRTWNTMDYDNPDRRPYWSNAQTNEQQFGILSFDQHKVRVNGEDDWPEDTKRDIDTDAHSAITSSGMNHDERYLYFQFHLDTPFEEQFSDEDPFTLYVSVRPDEGLSLGNGFQADFRMELASEESAHLEVIGDYDTFYFDYDYAVKELDSEEDQMDRLYTDFFPIRLALNQEVRRPDTQEILPFELYEAGELLYGIGDPDHADYHSLSDYVFSADQRYLEVRIPWMLLNARDPGTMEFMGSPHDGLGSDAVIHVDGLDFHVADGEADQGFGWTYTWDLWDMPEYEERLKQSYPVIQDVFAEID